MEILTKKDNKEIIKAPVCPHCGEPMLWSFCLPYCEYVCVPCGDGVGMMNAGEKREYPAEEIKALREKYAACIILPPVMLVLFILGMAAIMSWGFHNIGTKEFWETRARDLPLTLEYLKTRVSKEFGKQKWIAFCETLIGEDFSLSLYEAKKTYSKYITVRDKIKGGKIEYVNRNV